MAGLQRSLGKRNTEAASCQAAMEELLNEKTAHIERLRKEYAAMKERLTDLMRADEQRLAVQRCDTRIAALEEDNRRLRHVISQVEEENSRVKDDIEWSWDDDQEEQTTATVGQPEGRGSQVPTSSIAARIVKLRTANAELRAENNRLR